MSDALAQLEARIGVRFQTKGLLREAMTHASAAEGRRGEADYERLEFLGDRVLALVIANWLFKAFPHDGEDGLASRFNALVNRTACARAARRADLGAALVISKAEDQSGGRAKEAILADACEALIAALYLDGGLAPASGFIHRFWAEDLAAGGQPPRDPKTHLQEWAAARRLSAPVYSVTERTGPDHAPAFVVEVAIAGLAAATGEGPSKRDAERAAAKALLAKEGVHG